LSLGDLREYTFLPTSLFLLPIYFKQALDLNSAFGGRRLLVRRCPIEKSARVGSLFATRSDDVERCRGFDKPVNGLSIDVIIIEIRRVSKILHLLGDLFVFGRFACTHISPDKAFSLPIYFKQALDLNSAFGRRRHAVRHCPIEKSGRRRHAVRHCPIEKKCSSRKSFCHWVR
jgi:hypothetical protein